MEGSGNWGAGDDSTMLLACAIIESRCCEAEDWVGQERLGCLVGDWGLRFDWGLGFKVDAKGCACSYSELECNAALWEEAMETKA